MDHQIMSREPIEPGKSYWIDIEIARFKVRAIRPAVIGGWWHCEGEESGDAVVIPEDKLLPIEEETLEK